MNITKEERARFWAYVVKGIPPTEDSCWIWIGGVDRHGYGEIWIQRRTLRAHRVSYVIVHGPDSLADTDKLDHNPCDNRRCVNPRHLLPGSQWDNTRRSATNPVAINARKTHCVHGHEFTSANIKYNAAGQRACKTCGKRSRKEYRQRRRQKQAAE